MYDLVRKIILFWLAFFGSRNQKFFLRNRIKQDFSNLDDKVKYWVHASSVGEVNLLDSFLRECLERFDGEILLSVFTDTGRENALKKYEKENRVYVFYFPLDDKKEIKNILQRIDLKTLFLVETELWPNLIRLVSKRARVVLINGRISERSFGHYQKVLFLLKPLLQKISYFYVQTEEDKKRFLLLGAKENSCEVVGNLKFDIQVENFSQEEKEIFKQELGLEERKIWVAGSIRTGEYEILLDTFAKLPSNYVLVLVPRHLERIPKIKKYLEERKLSYLSYTEDSIVSENKNTPQVLLVDAMGVLRKLYAIADCTFVGGTLVNIGGHSLLEPLCYYKTPIFGTYTQNVKEIAKEILERNLGYQIQNAEELFRAIQQIEGQTPEVIQEIEQFLEANRQVGSRILEREES